MENKKIYHNQLLHYYKHPQNKGALQNASVQQKVFNPLCGDEVTVWLLIKNNIITQATFDGKGCVISLAAAAMLIEKCIDQPTQTIMNFSKQTMLDLINIELGPTRLRCALLALEAVQKACLHNTDD